MMKASELIAELQRAVAEHGDMDILVRDCSDGFDWNGITVCPDPPSPNEAGEGISGTIDINVYGESPINAMRERSARRFAAADRMIGIANNAIDSFGELLNGRDLYNALSGSLKMSDSEILAAGFTMLEEFMSGKVPRSLDKSTNQQDGSLH